MHRPTSPRAPLLDCCLCCCARRFIKLGQILSTRFDILPYDYVKGLEKLQDSVPAFDGDLAYQVRDRYRSETEAQASPPCERCLCVRPLSLSCIATRRPPSDPVADWTALRSSDRVRRGGRGHLPLV